MQYYKRNIQNLEKTTIFTHLKLKFYGRIILSINIFKKRK